MRLLKTRTLDFVDCVHPDTTDYAILSHTWGEEEVSLQDLHKPESKHLQGYKKIELFCAQALSHGYEYAWADTCCIDKKNSVELSEAINSMYNWYSWADNCYVYLNDVAPNTKELLRRSRWFTRGWTLQELLASWSIDFYDQNWQHIGDKKGLAGYISEFTGIEVDCILDTRCVLTASVAARMSWASDRKTSRPEDEAYCLMGLFDVNMPLLYGEGSFKAFRRLQHQIAANSEDESLFAWHLSTLDQQVGIFAPELAAFRGCANIKPVPDTRIQRRPYSITNRGLSISAVYQVLPFADLQGHNRLHGYDDHHPTECLLLPLKCVRKSPQDRTVRESEDGNERLITIILMSISNDVFVRWLPSEIMVYEKYFRPPRKLCQREIFIRPPTHEIDYDAPGVRLFLDTITEGGTVYLGYEGWRHCYVTPPSWIGEASPHRNHLPIIFYGWTGFAVLQPHLPRTYSIILRLVYTLGGNQTLTLSLFDGPSKLEEVVDSCYAQKDLLDLIPPEEAVNSIRIDEHYFVTLEKGHVAYHLSLSSRPKQLKASWPSTKRNLLKTRSSCLDFPEI
ncbi:MAG: hypothetical protein Q9209_004489 [Squamulea sp. 1 TL-2023]